MGYEFSYTYNHIIMLIHQTYMEVGHWQVGWLPLDYLSDAELLLDGWMLDHAGLDQGDEVVGAPVHLHSTVQYSTVHPILDTAHTNPALPPTCSAAGKLSITGMEIRGIK